MSAAELLESVPLFAGMTLEERDSIAGLMRPFATGAGEILFREHDPGQELYVLGSGWLRASRRAPGGMEVELAVLGPGEIAGEMSLIGPGTRTATITALEDARGWVLGRGAFEFLRDDLRPGSLTLVRRIGDLAVARLRNRYAEKAEALGPHRGGERKAEPLEEVTPEPGEAEYLRGTLFFSRLVAEEIETIVSGLRRLHGSRGALVLGIGEAPSALHLVVRGAVETTIRGGSRAQRVRLAGPGRAVGHLGLLDRGPSTIECRARERVILLELPWERVDALLSGTDSASRGFTAALNADVVRAVLAAERSTPQMIAAAVSVGGLSPTGATTSGPFDENGAAVDPQRHARPDRRGHQRSSARSPA